MTCWPRFRTVGERGNEEKESFSRSFLLSPVEMCTQNDDVPGTRNCLWMLRRCMLLTYGPIRKRLAVCGMWQGSFLSLMPRPPPKALGGRAVGFKATFLDITGRRRRGAAEKAKHPYPRWNHEGAREWLELSCPPQCAIEVVSVTSGDTQRVVCDLVGALYELRMHSDSLDQADARNGAGEVVTLMCAKESPLRMPRGLCAALWKECAYCPTTALLGLNEAEATRYSREKVHAQGARVGEVEGHREGEDPREDRRAEEEGRREEQGGRREEGREQDSDATSPTAQPASTRVPSSVSGGR